MKFFRTVFSRKLLNDCSELISYFNYLFQTNIISKYFLLILTSERLRHTPNKKVRNSQSCLETFFRNRNSMHWYILGLLFIYFLGLIINYSIILFFHKNFVRLLPCTTTLQRFCQCSHNTKCDNYERYSAKDTIKVEMKNITRGGSRAASTSKTECFVIIVNGCKPLTIITKHSILDVAAALDPPLITEHW